MKGINYIKSSLIFFVISLFVIFGLEILFEYFLYSEIKLSLINIYLLIGFVFIVSLVFFIIIARIKGNYDLNINQSVNNEGKDKSPYKEQTPVIQEINSGEIKNYLQELFELQDEFVFLADSENNILSAIGSYGNITSMQGKSNIIGLKLFEILNLNTIDRESILKLFKDVTSFRDKMLEFEFSATWNKEENRYLLREQIFYDEKGEIIHIIGVIRKINELFELRKNQVASKELAEAKEKIEQISKLKTTILTNINHELRSPIASILGLTEIILEEAHSDAVRGKILEINKAGLSLLNSVNSIINLGLLESSQIKFKIEECNINNVITEALYGFIRNGLIDEKNLEKNLTEDCIALVDKKLLLNILTNLFDNAIKYTFNGRLHIGMENKFDEKEKVSYCCITVKDFGAGLNEESRNLLFSDFRTLKDAIGNIHEESGLGLLVAKKMTELMKGKIEVLSSPGVGTEIKIYFPNLVPGTEKASKKEPVNNLTFSKDNLPKVLLVEDNNTNKVITVLFLKDLCKIDHAPDGNTAIELASKNKYDLILMDINLGPGINGIEVTSSIRKLPVNNSIPIIAVTGYAMPGDEEKLLHLGFDGYLAKPFTKESITNLIRSYLRIE